MLVSAPRGIEQEPVHLFPCHTALAPGPVSAYSPEFACLMSRMPGKARPCARFIGWLNLTSILEAESSFVSLRVSEDISRWKASRATPVALISVVIRGLLLKRVPSVSFIKASPEGGAQVEHRGSRATATTGLSECPRR
jgi:hypothetical protein